MKSNDGTLINLLTAAGIAAVGGALVFGMLLFIAKWMFLQAVFFGFVSFVIAAVFLIWAFTGPLPGPVVTKTPADVAAVRSKTTMPPVVVEKTVLASVPGGQPPAVASPASQTSDTSARQPAPDGKPIALSGARGGKPDDLKIVRGIGPKLESMLHGMGIFHFDQIADWHAAELAWVDENLAGFKGRASRDAWVPQAKILATGGTEAEAFAAADASKG